MLINSQTEVPLQLHHNLYQLWYCACAHPTNDRTTRPTTFAATQPAAPHSQKGL